jgi:ribosomal protein S18 acetylase RimI-like enzyme
MRVEYPRATDELVEHWQQEACFLAGQYTNDELIGFVDAQPEPWQNVLWIYNLVVIPAHRRQGFGTMLLEAAHQWAITHNLSRVTLEMQTKNHPAISFAQKHGFQFCGFNERYYPNGDIALFFSRPT